MYKIVSPTGTRMILTLMVLCLIMLPASSNAQTTEDVLIYEIDFESGLAPGWHFDPGWEVIRTDEGHVLMGQGHAWAIPDFPGAEDYRLQFQLKLERGRIHLVYRANDNGRYFLGLDAEHNDLNKQYWPNTFIEGLQTHNTPFTLNKWHNVEIVGRGPAVSLLIDGEKQWEYTDPEPLLYGAFAFETLDKAVVYVDDVRVYGPPPEPTPTPNPEFVWVRTGGPLGGLGYDVRMHPHNPDLMYVTDAFAGVFISEDGGRNWYPSNEGITTRVGPSGDSIPVFSLTIDPNNPDIIWVGTQNIRGIFKSTDGGRTWNMMDYGVVENEGITFRGFTVDPRDSNTVYAAAELASWLWAGELQPGREFDRTAGVVYKTTDGGENWSPVWRGDNLARYIWIDPRDSDTIYISTGIFDREAANSEPEPGIPGGEGVYKSTDGGQTWRPMHQGMSNLYVGTLFMHPENPDILLAGTGNNQYYEGHGIYLTIDGGATWEHVLYGDNINAVEFAVSNPQIAYAGSAGAIYRSDDGGYTWRKVISGEEGWGPPGVRAGFPIDFQVHPRDSNRIFANEYGGGNFVSNDGGQTWQVASKGYTGAQVRGLAVAPGSGRVYAAARSGIFSSQDGGENWVGHNSPPAFNMEWYVVAVDPVDDMHLLAANNWDGRIMESLNGGGNWEPVTMFIGENMGWRAFAHATSDPKVVYAGTSAFYSAGTFDDRMSAYGIYKSADGGASWDEANDELTQNANVLDLAVDYDDPQTVYAATGNLGLLKSTDGGESWDAITPEMQGEHPSLSVTLHPNEPDTVFVGFESSGLYRSQDGGSTWEPIVAGLNPESSVTDILYDPTDHDLMYLADVLSGVYRSKNSGETWEPIILGLNNRAVNKLDITKDGAHLYAATEGEGVYRLDLSGMPPEAPPSLDSPPPTKVAQDKPPQQFDSPTDEPEPDKEPTVTPSAASRGLCGSIFIIPTGLGIIVLYKRRR